MVLVSPEARQKLRAEWSGLKKNLTHPGWRCFCPACLFAEYHASLAGRSRPFDRESFFFFWLSFGEGRPLWRSSWPAHRRAHFFGDLEQLAAMVGLPLKRDPIRLKVNRLLKSRIVPELERRINRRPGAWPAPAPGALDWHLLWALVDFVFLSPGRRVTQHQFLKRFYPRWKKADLETVFRHPVLRLPAGSMPVLRAGRKYELKRAIESRGRFVISLEPK